MLQRNIHVFHQLFLAGNHLNQLIRKEFRIAVQGTQPLDALNPAKLLQKPRQAWLTIDIMAVVGSILGNQHDFPDALCHQGLHFLTDILNAAAPVPAPDEGNRAEGTAVIAPFRNLYIGSIRRRSRNPGHRSIINNLIFPVDNHPVASQRFLNGFHNAMPGAGTDNAISLRQIIQKLLPVPLPQATGNNQGFAPALARLLILRHGQDSSDGLLLGRLNKGTGIDNQHICLRRLIHQLISILLQNSQHNLRIHEIFGTAQTNKTCFQSISSFPGCAGLYAHYHIHPQCIYSPAACSYASSQLLSTTTNCCRWQGAPASPTCQEAPAAFPLENPPAG